MASLTYIELVLTCDSWQEAQKIADALLEKHLVACVEFIPIKSSYHWKQGVEHAKEVKLIMQSVTDNFEKVNKLVKKLHSYKLPSLHAVPISAITDEAAAWLQSETTGN